jgi:hypothetical protein
MGVESDRHTLELAKGFVVWIIGLIFATDFACVMRFLPASKVGEVPDFLFPAILALSISLIFAMGLYLRLVFLSSWIPVESGESVLSVSKSGLPSLASLLLIQLALVFLGFLLVLLWVLG